MKRFAVLIVVGLGLLISVVVFEPMNIHDFLNDHRLTFSAARLGALTVISVSWLVSPLILKRTHTLHNADISTSYFIKLRLLAWLWLFELTVGQGLWVEFWEIATS